MIKKFTLLLVMLLGITGVNAKSRTTTLWEETYTGGNIEIPVAELVQGATITVSASVTASGNADDKKLRVFYCKNDGNWTQTSFTDISDWVELSVGETSHSFTVTEAAMNILNDNTETTGSRGIMYIGANNKDYLTITKITQTETLEPTSTGVNLLNENWVVAIDGWEYKNFAAQTTAKIGDVIQIEVTVASGWKYTEVQVKDSEGNNLENTNSYIGNFAAETSATFEFEINNINDLEKIQSAGFRVNASNHATITSIKLLSYADSYDAVSIKVGSDGVATYSNGGKNVQISACDALKAYYASAVAKGIVTLTELTECIPANTGVIVYGSEGTYTVPVGSEGLPSITKNYLKPTGDNSQNVERSVSGTYHYIFAKDGDNIGFYLLGSDYSETYTEDEVEKTRYAHRLAAHKAYLETETDLSADAQTLSMFSRSYMRLSFGGGEGTTAINTALKNPIVEDGLYYTLQGVAVKNPSKGIYILNGKKVFVK